ncbi:NAD(P)/FAD-dependent oxidoreductase [Synechococcus sp. CBW1002]|uniref:NAD(P)/FAD-dependent oxidoreductase n=1 Tax=Synechococcus sp. CBW1002 TaxID=1353134 RepID=UPI0018CD5B89|nr:NAD(P)/FAD-dependent oxidoreductase [Synechococcus sp. CBW1002]
MAPIPSPTTTAEAWLSSFAAALAGGDPQAVVALFGPECFWRDLVAFTWNLRTEEGPEAIAAMLAARLADVAPHGFQLRGEASEAGGRVEAWFGFETRVGRCSGHLRLRDGRAWTLFTALDELKGHEERVRERRPAGAQHGVHPGRQSWAERREGERQALGVTEQPDVVIVGGGQAGLSLAARLRHLEVSALVLEKQPRPGDHWRRRYKSLCLHDPVHYCHFPYLPFPEGWPLYTPKDQLADWMEAYVSVMGLNVWGGSPVRSARFDPAEGRWQVSTERDGQPVVLRPRHLVFAMGVSGYPLMPSLPGAESFAGDQHHSNAHPGPDAYRGKRCVVVGSNNSAHDIAAALWEAGAAQVTMLQRSSTLIAPVPALEKYGFADVYSERTVAQGITAEQSDMTIASIPYKLLPQWQKPIYDAMRVEYADLYARLEKAGFLLDFGADDSGVFMKFLRRGSGYYLDVGASELVADGRIQLRSGVQIERLTPQTVVLNDGSELEADLVV